MPEAPAHTATVYLVSETTCQASPGPEVAWSDADLVMPHACPDKADRVRRMFAAIARSYDLNNRLHSLGQDQRWRRRAVHLAAVRSGEVVVDVACGTGDLTEMFAYTRARNVIGVDFTPQMLAIARRRARRLPLQARRRLAYMIGDAHALPLPDRCAHVLAIAFGLRNLTDPLRALREFARVLQPGGRLVILEFERPSRAPARWFYDFYCGWLMPRTATLISGDRTGAYRYLPRSIETFLDAAHLHDMLLASGFDNVNRHRLTFGLCVCTVATRAAR